jgi:hypothetical protein
MLHFIIWYNFTDVSEVLVAFIIRAMIKTTHEELILNMGIRWAR